jgi:hypothetical protein
LPLPLFLLSAPAFSATLPFPVATEPDPVSVKSAVADFHALSKKEKKHASKK